MSLSQEERMAVVSYRLEKAKRTWEQAEGNVANQYWEVIANRLYSLRLTGDYDDEYTLEEKDVIPLLFPAKEFIATISEMAIKALSEKS